MRAVDENLRISILRSEEALVQVAHLHQSAFSGLLAGELGIHFCTELYRAYLKSDSAIILICESGSQIVGFLSGFSKAPRTKSLKLLALGIGGLIKACFSKGFLVLIHLFRYVYKMISIDLKQVDAELFAIAVDPRFQKKGIGKKLVSEFEAFLKTKHVNIYKVVTDVEHSTGDPFYRKLNFELRKSKKVFGLTIEIFVKNILH